MAKATEKKLEEIYEYLVEFSKENSYLPSIREIGSKFDVKSTATVSYYLTKLEKKGYIRRSKTKNRAIELLKEKPSKLQGFVRKFNELPVVGRVAAGTPILAVENIEDVLILPPELFGSDEDQFVLNVTGDSMINAGILSGDKIIIKKQETAENGEIVVAMIDGNATVKRFYKEGTRVRLQPENDFLEPIYTDHVDIVGKVIGLIRNY